MRPDYATSAARHAPPEWVLVFGKSRHSTLADSACQEEGLNVRRTGDLATYGQLVDQRDPSLAIIDLESDTASTVIEDLIGRQVPLIALSDSSDRLSRYGGRVAVLIEKPFTAKGLQKSVNQVLGRK